MGKDDLPGFRHYTPAAPLPTALPPGPAPHTLTASRPPTILLAMEWQTSAVLAVIVAVIGIALGRTPARLHR